MRLFQREGREFQLVARGQVDGEMRDAVFEERKARLDAGGHAHRVVAVQKRAQVVVHVIQRPAHPGIARGGATVAERVRDLVEVVQHLAPVQDVAHLHRVQLLFGQKDRADRRDTPHGASQPVAHPVPGIGDPLAAKPGVAQEHLVRPFP